MAGISIEALVMVLRGQSHLARESSRGGVLRQDEDELDDSQRTELWQTTWQLWEESVFEWRLSQYEELR